MPKFVNFFIYDVSSLMKLKGRVNSDNCGISTVHKGMTKSVCIDKIVFMQIAHHTFAFHADREGLSLSTLRDLLDHSSLNITDVYLRQVRRNAELDEAVRDIF